MNAYLDSNRETHIENKQNCCEYKEPSLFTNKCTDKKDALDNSAQRKLLFCDPKL